MPTPMKPCCAEASFAEYLKFIDARLALGATEDARAHIEKLIRVTGLVVARPEHFHDGVVAMMPDLRAKLDARLELCGAQS